MQILCDISKEKVLKAIEQDNQYSEVIPMDLSIPLRIYFDIDILYHDSNALLRNILDHINRILGTIDNEWVICEGSHETDRGYKCSFHILSKYHTLSLIQLRELCKMINKESIRVDPSVYYNMGGTYAFFRFPNQSKIYEESIPMKIIQGELNDFLITETEGLTPLY